MDELVSQELDTEEVATVEATEEVNVVEEVPVIEEVVEISLDEASKPEELEVKKPKKKKKDQKPKKKPAAKKEKIVKEQTKPVTRKVVRKELRRNAELVLDVETWKAVAPLRMSVPVFVVAGALSHMNPQDKVAETVVVSAIRSFLGQSLG